MYSFPSLEPICCSSSVLTVASWPAYSFPRRQIRWSGTPISLRIFRFVVIHTVKGFSIVNEAEADDFLEFSCFSYDPMDAGNLISVYSTFSKSSFYFWKFSVHVLLKPSLKDFEHKFTSMQNEHNCPCSLNILWHCPSLGLQWKRPFQSCGHCWVFQIC